MNEVITMDMGDFIRRGIYAFIIIFAFCMMFAVIIARGRNKKTKIRHPRDDATSRKPTKRTTWKDF